MEPRNNVHVHINNIRTVFKIIRQYGPLSKRDLQDKTGLSWSAISTIVSLLNDNQYIVPLGKERTSVGRKPTRLDIQTNDYYTLGVEINSNELTVVIVNLKGEKIKETKKKFNNNDLDSVLNDVFFVLDDLIFHVLKDRHVIGIACALQGVVDSKRGMSVKIENIKNWENIGIRDIIKSRYNIDTIILHDTDCLMYAEYYTSAISSDNALLVRMDYQIGLGMALMIDGKVFTGNTGKSGEIGSMIIDTDKNGNDIFLADYIFQGHIIEKYCERANISGDITFEQIAELARSGDAIALDIFAKMGEYLGRALVNSANIFNPEVIVLNGSLTNYVDLFFKYTENVFKMYVYEKNTKIKISKVDSFETAYGAGLKQIDIYSNTIMLNENN